MDPPEPNEPCVCVCAVSYSMADGLCAKAQASRWISESP